MREELKTYISERKQVSLEELGRYFDQGSEAMEAHLEDLVASGCVLKQKPDPFGAVCFSACGGSGGEVRYRWVC